MVLEASAGSRVQDLGRCASPSVSRRSGEALGAARATLIVAAVLLGAVSVGCTPTPCGCHARSPDGASAPGAKQAVAQAPAASGEPEQASPPEVAAGGDAESRPRVEPPPEQPAPAATPAVEPLPAVEVKNIGLHVGGGPNDAATKAPFQRAVAAHFDELRRCYGSIESEGRSGSFGVDITIPAQGGVAEVSEPRTALGKAAFRDCVGSVLRGVHFEPPPRGATTISYSLSFTPTP